jgi:hypothetical protein
MAPQSKKAKLDGKHAKTVATSKNTPSRQVKFDHR